MSLLVINSFPWLSITKFDGEHYIHKHCYTNQRDNKFVRMTQLRIMCISCATFLNKVPFNQQAKHIAEPKGILIEQAKPLLVW